MKKNNKQQTDNAPKELLSPAFLIEMLNNRILMMADRNNDLIRDREFWQKEYSLVSKTLRMSQENYLSVYNERNSLKEQLREARELIEDYLIKCPNKKQLNSQGVFKSQAIKKHFGRAWMN